MIMIAKWKKLKNEQNIKAFTVLSNKIINLLSFNKIL